MLAPSHRANVGASATATPSGKRQYSISAKSSAPQLQSLPSSLVPQEKGASEPIHVALRVSGNAHEGALEVLTAIDCGVYTASDATYHDRLLTPLVLSAFNGFHANILALGATPPNGAHTLWGNLTDKQQPEVDEEDSENRPAAEQPTPIDGAVAFALGKVFDRIALAKQTATSCLVAVSLFSINAADALQDHLASEREAAPTLKLQEDGAQKLQVAGLKKKIVTSKNHAMRILANVLPNVDKSHHLVVIVTIEQRSQATGIIASAQLQFIDFAAPTVAVSADPSDPTKRIVRRTTSTSAANFEKVVTLLANQSGGVLPIAAGTVPSSPSSAPFIPFRESKLTRLVKDGLGQLASRTHTLFVINMQPGASEANLSATSLVRKLAKISNVMSDNIELAVVPQAQSLHYQQEQAASKRTLGLQANPQPSPSRRYRIQGSPTGSGQRSAKRPSISEGPCAPGTPSRVRRALFEPAATPAPQANVAAAAPLTDSCVTPRPSRQYSITAATPVATPSVVLATPAASPQASPIAQRTPGTRKWSFTPKATAAPSPSTDLNTSVGMRPISEHATASIPQTPASTRRWTFKSKAATEVPAPNDAVAMLEQRLADAVRTVEELTSEQAQAERAAAAANSPTRAAAIRDAAEHLARESAAVAHCEALRAELAELKAKTTQPLAEPSSILESTGDDFNISLIDVDSSTIDESAAYHELEDKDADEATSDKVHEDASSPVDSSLAELMRRSLDLPACFRRESHAPLPAPTSALAAAASSLPLAQAAHLNVVNTVFRPTRQMDARQSLSGTRNATDAATESSLLASSSSRDYQSLPDDSPSPKSSQWLRAQGDSSNSIADVASDDLNQPLTKNSRVCSDEAESEAARLAAESSRLALLRKLQQEERSAKSFWRNCTCTIV